MPATFRDRADLARRLGCEVEELPALGAEDTPGHCQLSITGSMRRGAKLQALNSRTGKPLLEKELKTRQEINRTLRHTFNIFQADFPFKEEEEDG